MSVNRSELHALLDRIPDADLAVTRKVLQALATNWDVAPADSEGDLTDEARRQIEAAESYFDRGGAGIPHEEILREFDLK
jgi:hypothetical protein